MLYTDPRTHSLTPKIRPKVSSLKVTFHLSDYIYLLNSAAITTTTVSDLQGHSFIPGLFGCVLRTPGNKSVLKL